MKALRSDRGGEYMSNAMKELLAHRGIITQPTPAYTPEQNGKAKRENSNDRKMTPHEKWNKKKPTMDHTKTVGCDEFVLIPTPTSSKV